MRCTMQMGRLCVRRHVKIPIHPTAPFHATSCLYRSPPQQTCNPFEPQASEVIDVRTEREFSLDHIPGARNLPVLTQAQHVEVGTRYTDNAFQARKLGARYVASCISKHIENYFQEKDENYSPLVYCWRGGQRSNSLAIVLAEIGFRVFVLKGGYKSYRHIVTRDLDILPREMNFRVITGLTGSGKTFLLHQLSERGQQVLDLEGLACHKGSTLGLWHNHTQPSQKMWESLLRDKMSQLDSTKPVWVESESRRIGRVTIPGTLFDKMGEGQRYEVNLPMSERVRHIIKDYPHWISDVEKLKTTLAPLARFVGKKKVYDWYDLLAHDRFEEFVESILRDHYDPTYTKSQAKALTRSTCDVKQFHLENIQESAVDQFIDHIIDS
ncbi:tRNA 2-selenouridine synthase-like isoform X2 [Haliotis rufescens]|nr:tRNA 2-selenouridine synthase-like isoform X2 [Haliotis rufescens]